MEKAFQASTWRAFLTLNDLKGKDSGGIIREDSPCPALRL
jgi:hypothetical protein